MSTSSDRAHAAEGGLATSFLLLVYVNAFVTGAVVMGFEMLGSRYLNPYFGSGIYTWAALISTVLAALTGGYFFGGWMADRKPTPAGLGWLIVGGSAYLAFIPLFAEPLMEFISALLGAVSDQREFERWGSIIGAMLLLFVPLALLGVYSPYAIRLTLRATSRSGTVAGRIYGISTLGSIFGTLFVTFYLIPTMGSRHITYLLSAVGVAAGLSFLVAGPAGARRALPAVAALLLAALAAPAPLLAEPPPRAHPAQAGPEAKETAERFLAYLKKQGYAVAHGGIEAGPPPAGFRLKNFSLSEPNRGAWRAAWVEAATFEERASGETAMTGFAAEGLEGSSGKDKDALKAARLAVGSAAWTAGPKIEIKIGGVALRALETVAAKGDVAKLAELDIERLRLDVPTGGALERLSARGFTFAGKGESGSLASITAESVEVDLNARLAFKNIVFSDLVANPPAQGPIRIGAIEFRALELLNPADRNPGNLRVLEFAIKRIEAPLAGARDEAFARDMQELGYTVLKMSAELVYRYDEASKTFDLAKLEFDVAEMGALILALKVAGLSPEDIKKAMEPPPAPQGQTPPGQTPPPGNGSREGVAAMGLLARLNLVSADLAYRDKSILGRAIKREAQRKQTDEASIRAQYRALLVGLRDQQTDPLAKEAIDAVIAFLENPGEILVEVRPPAPLNLLAIGAMAASNPAQLRTLLGIKITAKKP
ncbi:MAG TPA: fused MFS/spermidine synthase [Alphaproteobacteria bacterium]|jgi:MFS family permease